MTAKILASLLLLIAPVAAGTISVDLASHLLKGEVVQMGRKGRNLTVAMKITNLSKDADAFVLVWPPSAFEDSGGRWSSGSATITGIAYCPGPDTNPPSFRLCVGVPKVDKQYLFPMQGYTNIEPGGSITVHYQFISGGEEGHRISLAHDLAYRFATPEKDALVGDDQKLKARRSGGGLLLSALTTAADLSGLTRLNMRRGIGMLIILCGGFLFRFLDPLGYQLGGRV